jgi:hypothetical protein
MHFVTTAKNIIYLKYLTLNNVFSNEYLRYFSFLPGMEWIQIEYKYSSA